MKKAFSLMEVIISVVILSVVMLTLLQIKSGNIYLVSKSDQKSKINDYILMAVDFNNKIIGSIRKIAKKLELSKNIKKSNGTNIENSKETKKN